MSHIVPYLLHFVSSANAYGEIVGLSPALKILTLHFQHLDYWLKFSYFPFTMKVMFCLKKMFCLNQEMK